MDHGRTRTLFSCTSGTAFVSLVHIKQHHIRVTRVAYSLWYISHISKSDQKPPSKISTKFAMNAVPDVRGIFVDSTKCADCLSPKA